MFSEKDLVARTVEDMSREVEELQAESSRLRLAHGEAMQKEEELRRLSVESRPGNAEMAEALWQEAERLREDGREMLRLSLEQKLRAAEILHRIEIHDQIESLDNYDEAWRKAAKAGRG
jgi:hypothetical protein